MPAQGGSERFIGHRAHEHNEGVREGPAVTDGLTTLLNSPGEFGIRVCYFHGIGVMAEGLRQ